MIVANEDITEQIQDGNKNDGKGEKEFFIAFIWSMYCFINGTKVFSYFVDLHKWSTS